MEKRTIIPLTQPILNEIQVHQILYCEFAGIGAMGNAGGLMMYIVREKQLICYETNLNLDGETYTQSVQLIMNHQDVLDYATSESNEVFFQHFYGGMGNHVFINKNIALEVEDGYFVYKVGEEQYQILPSVQGVFESVVYSMKNFDDEG
jgi:hypothetical protein